MSGNPQQSINPFENFAPQGGGPPAPAPTYTAPSSGGFGWGAAMNSAWVPARQPVPTDEPDSPLYQQPNPTYTLEPREAAPIWSQPQAGPGGPPQGVAWGSTAGLAQGGPQPEVSAPSSAMLLQPGSHMASDGSVPAVAGAAAAGGAAAGAGGSKPSWMKMFGGGSQQQQAGGPDPAGSDTRPLLPDGTAAGAAGRPGAQGQQGQQGPEDYSKYAFYNIRKYRPYFNVDTKEVLWRVLSSFIGMFKADFIEVTLEKPDLYGPFWVATTLVFVTAAAGNLYSYVNYRKSSSSSPPPTDANSTAVPAPSGGTSPTDVVTNQWFADPTKLGTSAGIFYGYVFILSILLWLWIKYMRGDIKLVNVFCMYGYAMTIFIPIAALCIIPNAIVQWVLIMTATVVSGGFLVRNLRSATASIALIKTIWLLGVVFALQVGLGLALKLYFFRYS